MLHATCALKLLVHMPLELRPFPYLAALQEAQVGSEAEAHCLAGDRKFFGHAEPSATWELPLSECNSAA